MYIFDLDTESITGETPALPVSCYRHAAVLLNNSGVAGGWTGRDVNASCGGVGAAVVLVLVDCNDAGSFSFATTGEAAAGGAICD